MKKTFKFFVFFIIAINLFILISGKSWVYRAIYSTYLQGHTSAHIDDHVFFYSNEIKKGSPQKWNLSLSYNAPKLNKSFEKTLNEYNTTAFLVVKDDSIRFEKYWNGYSSKKLSNSFSVTKSIVGLLAGVAIKEKKIKSINDKVCDYLPEFCEKERSKISIKHLITMSSGLNWSENYYNPLGQTAQAYYGNDLKELMFGLEPIEEPGVTFRYHSSCSQILTYVIESAVGMSINQYASLKLWKKIGCMHSAIWSLDKKNGDEKGFCCINSNARDLARIGKLYLNHGFWNDQDLVDSAFIINATSSNTLLNVDGSPNKNYGYHLWIAKYKNLNVFYAKGFCGQYIIWVPQKKLIIVRLGNKESDEKINGHHVDFYKYLDVGLALTEK